MIGSAGLLSVAHYIKAGHTQIVLTFVPLRSILAEFELLIVSPPSDKAPCAWKKSVGVRAAQ